MTMLAITVPWQQLSPLYLQRRDLVADTMDSLSISMTLVESDDPDAPPADLVTGPTFPGFGLWIWSTPGGCGRPWDYGWRVMNIGTLLWSGAGAIDPVLPGTVNWALPFGTMTEWPWRCGWALRVGHDGTLVDTLCTGFLNLHGAGSDLTASPTGAFRLDSSRLG
jgi:hypothetical protein